MAQGFGQNSTDIDEVFAQILKKNCSLYIALVITAKEKCIIKHLEIMTTYLHAPLRQTVCMKKTPGAPGNKGWVTEKKPVWPETIGLQMESLPESWNQCSEK